MSEYRIGPSEIQGRGVFSTKEYRRGDLVGVYEGRVTRRVTGSRFLLLMGNETWGVLGTNDLKYLNSSRRPNCRVDDALGVFALRRIRSGDELTFDYSYR